jgi:hypothetical protein
MPPSWLTQDGSATTHPAQGNCHSTITHLTQDAFLPTHITQDLSALTHLTQDGSADLSDHLLRHLLQGFLETLHILGTLWKQAGMQMILAVQK